MNENKKKTQNLIKLRDNILFIFYCRVKRWGDFYFYGTAYCKTTAFDASLTYSEDVQYSVLGKKLFSKVYIPEYSGGCQKIVSLEIPDRYTAIIRDCKIVGGCSFVLKNENIIYNLAFDKESYRYDLNRGDMFIIKRTS